VSQLELAQLVGSSTMNGKKHSASLNETSSQDIVVAADKIFTRSRQLDGAAVVDFVRALCEVSKDELKQMNPPRMYSLTKTVEIAYYNMERVRLEWAHIWSVMGEYFNTVGCMANDDVAFFAVDSLRQLSIKFLEKGELANYSFQKDFLRPFEYIMQHNKSFKLRDMVVRCVAHLVQSKAANIRSGWKNIFFVFSLAASDTDQNIVNLAFTTTKHIFENYFSKTNDHRASLIAASFMDAVNCLSEFACNSHFPELSMDAIRQLRVCASAVADAPELFANPQDEVGYVCLPGFIFYPYPYPYLCLCLCLCICSIPMPLPILVPLLLCLWLCFCFPLCSPAHPVPHVQKSDEPQIWVRGWFPVLFGLSRIINRCKLDVRTRALTVMFEIMKTCGDRFLAQWWTDLFRVVFRIFDDKKLAGMGSEQEKSEWMSTTCTHALRSIVDVVSQYFDVLQGCVLKDLLSLLTWSITRENEQLARTGTECLHILVMNNGFAFTDESWQLACDCLQQLFTATEPSELISFGTEQQEKQVALQADQAALAAIQDAQKVAAPKPEAPAEPVEAASATKDSKGKSKDKPKAKAPDAEVKAPVEAPKTEKTAESGGETAGQDPGKGSKLRSSQQQLFSRIIIKCVVQLELIQTIEWIVLSSTRPESAAPPKRHLPVTAVSNPEHRSAVSEVRLATEEVTLAKPLDQAGEMFECLTSERLLLLLDCLLKSYTFARDFNADDGIRTALWQAGFMRNRSKPNLLKQETTSLGCSLRILFRMYEAESRKAMWADIEDRIQAVCTTTLFMFLSTVGKETRDIWIPIINLILREVVSMPEDRFVMHSKLHYDAFAECMTVAFDSHLGDLAFVLAAFFKRCRAVPL
jgi:hypothetical protein